MKLSHFASALALTFGVLTHVHAAPLTLGDKVTVENRDGTVFTPGLGDGLFTNVTFKLNETTNGSASAGLFVLDYKHVTPAVGTSWTQFLSFCLEPDVLLTPFDNPYTVKSIAGAGYGAVSDAISELWARHFASVTSDVKAAAFQVALWELAFGESDRNLDTGAFQLVTGGDVKTKAQEWLASLSRDGSGPKARGLVVLKDNDGTNIDNQDLLTQGPISDVPEPAMLALLGIGLAGIGLARRRQSGAAQAA